MEGIKPPAEFVPYSNEKKWETWRESFEIFAIAVNLESMPLVRQRAILKHIAGEKTVMIYKTFHISENDTYPNVKEMLDMLTNHFKPFKNTIQRRNAFFICVQKEKQGIMEFVTELKHLAQECEFENLTESLIRDRLIIGILDREVKRKLLEDPQLTLPRAISIAVISESTCSQVASLNEQKMIEKIEKRNWVKDTIRMENAEAGPSGINPRRERIIEPLVCRTKRIRNLLAESEAEESCDEINLNEVAVKTVRSDKWSAVIIINGKKTTVHLDTGAQINVLPHKVINQWPSRPEIRPTSLKAFAYGNTELPIVGKCNVLCQYGEKKGMFEFIVADVEAQTLITGDTCEKLEILRRINHINTDEMKLCSETQKILEQYHEVFQGVGLINSELHVVQAMIIMRTSRCVEQDRGQTDVKREMPPPSPPPPPPPQDLTEVKTSKVNGRASVIYRHIISMAPGLCRTTKSETMHIISQLYAQLLIVTCAVVVFSEVLHLKMPLLFFHVYGTTPMIQKWVQGYLFTFLVGGAIVCLLGVYISMAVDKCPRLTGVKVPFPNPALVADDRYDISLCLRIGALVFGLGTLTSACLEVAMIFSMPELCSDELNLAQPVLRGLFTFLQLHFFFLNAQEVMRSLGWFRHVALMHLLATNTAVWVRLVLWESARGWLLAQHHRYNSTERWPPVDLNFTEHSFDEYGNHHVYFISDVTLTFWTPETGESYNNVSNKDGCAVTGNCWWIEMKEEGPEEMLGLYACLQNTTVGMIWYRALPYMYPFIIQYSLLAAAVVFVLWSNVPIRRSRKSVSSFSENGAKDDSKKSLLPFRIDCRDSSKGLFLGMLVLVAGIIILIMFFVLSTEHTLDSDSVFSIVTMHCSILIISFVGIIIGLIQIRKLPNRCRYKQDLSTVLQNTTILAVYAYGILNLIIGSSNISVLEYGFLFADGMFMVLQAFVQTLFIHQLARKQGPTYDPNGTRPSAGRQVMIFMVFVNMSLWLMEAFTAQNEVATLLQTRFYGRIPWGVVCKIALPLITFYRFHSLATLLDYWRFMDPGYEIDS
ncbi:Otopetrin [Cordylochernes scorpioides]|uniref:Otopetrin n=1 Tax=Cordylochernes scorpioides TaxID=51811 RepID=A0ABY6JUT8_9ARAC|nr:Otopetrin [Cordylochernes scorpioides]